MGYTHYWTQPADYTVQDWRVICRHFGMILDAAEATGIALANGAGDADSAPVLSNAEITFNGAAPDDYETFSITRKREPLQSWQDCRGESFCKTQYRPYDAVVTAVLAYLAHVWAWDVSSDGDAADWQAGMQLASSALGRPIPNPFEESAP